MLIRYFNHDCSNVNKMAYFIRFEIFELGPSDFHIWAWNNDHFKVILQKVFKFLEGLRIRFFSLVSVQIVQSADLKCLVELLFVSQRSCPMYVL